MGIHDELAKILKRSEVVINKGKTCKSCYWYSRRLQQCLCKTAIIKISVRANRPACRDYTQKRYAGLI